MGRTNVVVDDELIERVMKLYNLRTKREAIDFALRQVVAMELLAGARSGELERVGSLVDDLPVLPLQGLADYESAAALYRGCQRAGEAVRELTDCLVAVPAIRAGAPVLHSDADFEKLARHTPLEVVPLDA